MSGRIASLRALEIFDSRGTPTLSVTLTTEGGVEASASVPSGASTGTHEAVELRDDDATRFAGQGALLLCGTCMDARGLADTEMVAGAQRSNMAELAAATLAADKVLVF